MKSSTVRSDCQNQKDRRSKKWTERKKPLKFFKSGLFASEFYHKRAFDKIYDLFLAVLDSRADIITYEIILRGIPQ